VLAKPHAELIEMMTAAEDKMILESFAAVNTLIAKMQGTMNPPT